MDQLAEQAVPMWLAQVLLAGLAVSVALWIWAFLRWRRGQFVIPFQPRKQVPWGVSDLLVVLVVFLSAQVGMLMVARAWFGEAAMNPRAADIEGGTVHVVARLIAEGDGLVVLACFVAAVIVAPIAEEFLFRVLLQGWLESVESRARRILRAWPRWFFRGAGPIVITSLLFAQMHYRTEQPAMNMNFLVFVLVGTAIANIVTMAAAIAWMRWHAGATAVDLGWERHRFLPDVGLGLATFVAVGPALYLLQSTLTQFVLPKHIAADPFALLFFALFLGLLYYRTHRATASITLHMALNATSVLMVWLLTRGG